MFDMIWKEKDKILCVLKSKLCQTCQKNVCQSIIVHNNNREKYVFDSLTLSENWN